MYMMLRNHLQWWEYTGTTDKLTDTSTTNFTRQWVQLYSAHTWSNEHGSAYCWRLRLSSSDFMIGWWNSQTVSSDQTSNSRSSATWELGFLLHENCITWLWNVPQKVCLECMILGILDVNVQKNSLVFDEGNQIWLGRKSIELGGAPGPQ